MPKSCLFLGVFDKQKLWRGHENAQPGLLEPSPHDDLRRTNILCAHQFIVQRKCVIKYHCGPLIYFLIQYNKLNSFNFKHHLSPYI